MSCFEVKAEVSEPRVGIALNARCSKRIILGPYVETYCILPVNHSGACPPPKMPSFQTPGIVAIPCSCLDCKVKKLKTQTPETNNV